MKLNLLLLAMDMLTILAYPILFAYAKLRLFSKFREDIAIVNLLVPSPITPGR